MTGEVLNCLYHATHPPKNGFDVIECERYRVVVFPPTEGTAWSWMWNLFIAPFNGVHLGLSLYYLSVVDRVLKVIELRERRKGARKPLLFTGFSRGGALAEMCTVDPLFEPWSPECISFSAPRWGMKQYRDVQITRIQVGGDIVTQLPPWPYQDCVKPLRLRWKCVPRFSAHRYSVYREAVWEGIK